ncbi:unnamed protein product [Cuscuta campestris]|uniref:Uncharacterized protein n=1 Tax=Cuscuta campestris TaxID=132261 RepID=A0A484MI80_9ASTE|nr:unnamed protein product [Cuscuta campestris]
MNRLSKKKGAPVSLDEVIIHTKTKKHDGQSWVDPVVAELQAQFLELREEARKKGLKVTDEQIWYSLVEGHNAKNRVPGVGDYEHEMRKMNQSSKPRRSAKTSSSAMEIAALRAKNEKLQEEFDNLRSNLTLIIHEELKKLLGGNLPPRRDDDERIHVDDDEENTGIYTNTQSQTEEIPQATNQGDEENQEEEEEQEEHEQEATELPIAWRTNKNHPLDQEIGSINRGGRFEVKESESQLGGTSDGWVIPSLGGKSSLFQNPSPHRWVLSPIDGLFFIFHQSFSTNASIMARGKSKSKASKKKVTAEASSSALPSFPYLDGSFLEFGSEEELTRFLTYFAKRPISPPRVLPELFPQQKGYHDLDNQLKESGLWPFVSKSRTSYNPAFVRAFYSNLRRLPIRGDNIATYGGDDWILNNEAVVIRKLGITNLIRHSGAPTIHSAPPDKRLLLYIITRILRPRDSSHTSLFNEDLKAIHAIIHGASINWAKFVMIHMADCASIANERSLPYAFLVMDLFIASDIHIAGPDTKMTKIWIIQDSTFRKKSGDQDGARPSRARAPARAPVPAPARASLQSIADTLNRLTLTVDDMGQYMERMNWTLQRQHHDMTAFFRGINYVPPPFDSTILGQNFEGKGEDDDSYAPSSSPDEADFEDAVDGDPMDVEDDEDDDDDENKDADA